MPTRQVLVRLLRAEGQQVHGAGSKGEAEQLAAQHIALPDGSGLDLMPVLRDRHGVKLGIALSGFGAETDLQASRDAGSAEHLVKPVNVTAIQPALARADASEGVMTRSRQPWLGRSAECRRR